MHLEHGLDLFGVDLLAAGVDAQRPAPEQVHGAVGVDGGHVAGQRPALAVDLHERARAALGILVVAERHAATSGEPADDAAAGRRPGAASLVDHDRLGFGGERERRRRRAAAGRDRDRLRGRLRRADALDDREHRRDRGHEAVLHLARQDAAARAEQPQRREVPAARLRGRARASIGRALASPTRLHAFTRSRSMRSSTSSMSTCGSP